MIFNIEKNVVFFFFMCGVNLLYGQSIMLSGCITDTSGQSIIGAHISIIETDHYGISQDTGCFSIETSSIKKQLTLRVSYIGYKTQLQKIDLSSKKTISMVLEPEQTQLQEVVVQGKSKAEKKREQAYAIHVIKANTYKNSAIDVNQVLNQVPGIIIRQDAGLGSNFNLSLNGLSGNQVRVFIDGVAMQHFGSSLSLDNFPVNTIASIEVYKGVVPIHLASDALAGAINIVTKSSNRNYLDLSYTTGSFNTHRASINGQWYTPKNGFIVNFKSFYNYSDNDYKIDVLLPNQNGTIAKHTTKVRRFHDGYTSKMAQLELGVVNKSYADVLQLGFLVADNYKELQNKPLPDKVIFPFGQVYTTDKNYITTLKYQKKQLVKKLDVASFFTHVFSKQRYVDKSDYKYDWYGNTTNTIPSTTGEYYKKTDLTLDKHNLIGNINTQYSLSKAHLITFNMASNFFRMQGKDPLYKKNLVQFGNPSTTFKNIAALSYAFDHFNKTCNTTLFAKQFFYAIKGIKTDPYATLQEQVKNNHAYTGFGMATTYRVSKKAQIKFSMERAIRFPENTEVLGNGVAILTNIALKPEQSYNINLGYRLQKNMFKNAALYLETNMFYRNAKNYIYIRPELVFKMHDNLERVSIQGVEAQLQYTTPKKHTIGLNATYLDIREKSAFLPGTQIQNTFYNARIPNIPYGFGTLYTNLYLPHLFARNDSFSIRTISQYTHAYHLYFEKVASSDIRKIPSQFSQNLEFTYSDTSNKYHLSFMLNNLFNTRLTDNFNLQKPGINFNVKLRYNISK